MNVTDKIAGLDFEVGDLVYFKAEPNTFMNISEIALIESADRKKLSREIEDTISGVARIECYWCHEDYKKGITYNKGWFMSDELMPVTINNKGLHKLASIELKEIVRFRGGKKVVDLEPDSNGVKVKKLKIYQQKLFVTEIKKESSKTNLKVIDREGNVKIVRQCAERMVKCKWFNAKENKFSEQYFPETSITNNLELPIITIKSNPSQV
ncbi:MAG: hypothetical protein ACI81T_000282 [Bacteroidia bacterium]|jgi:uncharacterized protein YodC (DUF2158 family)